MSDDVDVKKLVAEVRNRAAEWQLVYGADNYPPNLALAVSLADALVAVSARPLVADEDAVRERIAYSLAMEHGHVDYPEGGQVDRASQSAARALFASGVIQSKGDAQVCE